MNLGLRNHVRLSANLDLHLEVLGASCSITSLLRLLQDLSGHRNPDGLPLSWYLPAFVDGGRDLGIWNGDLGKLLLLESCFRFLSELRLSIAPHHMLSFLSVEPRVRHDHLDPFLLF